VCIGGEVHEAACLTNRSTELGRPGRTKENPAQRALPPIGLFIRLCNQLSASAEDSEAVVCRPPLGSVFA
jgi:hypothetical protein